MTKIQVVSAALVLIGALMACYALLLLLDAAVATQICLGRECVLTDWRIQR